MTKETTVHHRVTRGTYNAGELTLLAVVAACITVLVATAMLASAIKDIGNNTTVNHTLQLQLRTDGKTTKAFTIGPDGKQVPLKLENLPKQ